MLEKNCLDHKRIVVLCLIAFCVISALQSYEVVAQDSDPIEAPLVAPPSADEVLAWVGQLGSQQYAQREQASLALLETGRSALPYLHDAADGTDLEVTLRCERIISAIEVRIIQRRRAAFLEAGSPGKAAPVGWAAFSELVGDTKRTREFFLGMHEAEPELMLTAESKLDNLLEMLKARTKRLEEIARNQRQVGVRKLPVSSYSLATFFFLSNLQEGSERVVIQRINSLIGYSDFRTRMRVSQEQKVLLALMTQYIAKQLDASSPDASLHASTLLPLALAYNVPGVLPVAVQMLEGSVDEPKKLNPTAAMYAAITIGRFGNKQHVELLESHFADERTCWTYTRNNERRQTHVGDMALVMSLHLLRQEPRRFNFDILSRVSDKVYQPYTVSFVDDEQRQKSRDAWKQFKQTGAAPDLPQKKDEADKEGKPAAADVRKRTELREIALPKIGDAGFHSMSALLISPQHLRRNPSEQLIGKANRARKPHCTTRFDNPNCQKTSPASGSQ